MLRQPPPQPQSKHPPFLRSPRPALLSKTGVRKAMSHLRKADPVMGRLIRQYGPCPMGTEQTEPFVRLVRAITGQQLSTKAARAIFEKCIHAAGEISPEALLACEDSTLRAAGLSARKAEYVKALSQAVLAGEVDFTAFRKLDDEEVIKTLVSVKGVGRWTAEMFLIFSLGRANVLPQGDLGLNNAVKKLYGENAQIINFKERWSPFCSVACWYLWASLDNTPDET